VIVSCAVPERSKNGLAHDVPLSESAVAVLDRLAEGDGWPRKGIILTTTGKTPISGFGKVKDRLDAGMHAILAAQPANPHEGAAEAIPAWRVHDLRRTVATGLQRLGVRFEVTEAVLNHVSGSRAGIAGVYQRHDWKAEKRDALDAWGRHVAALLNA
jgi:integrase